jgi:hypothetical protein
MKPTLGQTIRGMRLGYGWVPELNRWMHIDGDGPFTIKIRCSLPNTRDASETHRRWWDDKLFLSELLKCEGMGGLGNGDCTIFLDDYGKRVEKV